MWFAKYTGPRTDIADHAAPDWRTAREAVVVQIKTVAPIGTYATLVVAATQEPKPDQEWQTTDGTHTFGLTRAADANGWTGRKCPACGGHGERSQQEQDESGVRACASCAGTGEENVDALSLLDDEPLNDGCPACNGDCANANAPVISCPMRDAPTPEHIGSGINAEESIAESEIAVPYEPAKQPDVDHTAREHSELGGSIVERFGNCAGSVRLVRGLPNPETLASKRGTAAHEVAHLALLNGQDAIEYIGRTVNDIEIDEPIADGVQAHLDDCRACPATEVFYEVRFNLESLGPPAPMYGTADFVGYDALEQRLYVKDYKNGFKYVDADGNKQLRYYALGALLALGDDKPVSDIRVTICQPNALGATLKTDTFDAVELVEWAQWLMAAARRTQDPDAPATAGPWCDATFCPARGSCSVRAAYALEAAQVEFADYLSPMRTPEVRLLSAAERGAIYGAADGLRAFLSAIEDSIKADTAGTGWKLVPTDTRQAWRDKDEAAATLRMDHGIDPYEPADVISPAVARGLLKESLHAERVAQHATGKKPTKKESEQAARLLLADLITDISSGTKLVPEADSRPAIPTGGAEFDKVTV